MSDNTINERCRVCVGGAGMVLVIIGCLLSLVIGPEPIGGLCVPVGFSLWAFAYGSINDAK